MDITINELLRRKKAVQNQQVRSGFLAATDKNKHERECNSPDTHFSGKESSPDLSSCSLKVGEKRKRNVDGEICKTESRIKSEDVVTSLSEDGDAREEFGSGNQLHEVHLFQETLPYAQLNRTRVEISQNLDEADKFSESNTSSKRQAIYFASKGKVFQTGQIWSFYSGEDELPLYYGRIQKITFTQAFKQDPVFKLHISLLKPLPFPDDVIQWRQRSMPVASGTFYARKVVQIITPDDVSHQVVPQTSMDGKEYTIFPKIGEVWAIYRSWSNHIELHDLEYWHYDLVEVLDDALGDYKVLLLQRQSRINGVKTFFRAATRRRYNDDDEDEDEDGTEPIFTIPKSRVLRFSHQVPVSRVTKEKFGDLVELYEIYFRAVPFSILSE